ncbi:hypothetical protein [Streptomyces virginiae]|nr:hypothetical protein [Streptomyces virginiae]MCX4960189.1 hypothetical protein [Streptomyces virginiae]
MKLGVFLSSAKTRRAELSTDPGSSSSPASAWNGAAAVPWKEPDRTGR